MSLCLLVGLLLHVFLGMLLNIVPIPAWCSSDASKNNELAGNISLNEYKLSHLVHNMCIYDGSVQMCEVQPVAVKL